MKKFPTRNALLAAIVSSCLAAAAPADEPKAEANPAEQVQQWLKDLDSDIFSTRQTAAQRLAEAGKDAADALADGAMKGSLEATTQSLDILRKLHQTGDDDAKAAAKKALERVAAGENQSAARRAKEILEPPPAPAEQPGGNIIGGGIRVIGPGQIQIMPLPAGGAAGRIRIQAQNVNGAKNIEVDDNGKKVKIAEDGKGIEIQVTEKVDGKDKTDTFKAKDADELKKNHPEAHKLYEKYAAKGAGGGIAVGGVIIGGAAPVPGVVPMPAMPRGLNKEAAKQLDDASSELDRLYNDLKQQLGDKPDAEKLLKDLQAAKAKLDEARKQLER